MHAHVHEHCTVGGYYMYMYQVFYSVHVALRLLQLIASEMLKYARKQSYIHAHVQCTL